jgi:hypothetical protein
MNDSDMIFLFVMTVLGGLGMSYVMFAVGCYVGWHAGRKDEREAGS